MKHKLEAAAAFAMLSILSLAPIAPAKDLPSALASTDQNASVTVGATGGQRPTALAKEEKEDDDDKDEKGKKHEEKEEEDDEEEAITLDQAPAAVQAAIKQALGTNKLEKLTKEESEKGEKDKKATVVYEASFKDNGSNHTISLNDAGKIVEDEQEIKTSELPAAVTKAVEAKAAGAKIAKAERVKADGKTFYEVAIGEGKKARELKVAEDGKVLEDESKDEEHEHHGKGKDDDDDEKEGKEKK